MRLLYQGMLRTLLVLLHDFPEFLSDYHLSFCDVIPPTCIQLRNLVLASFPRSMRLPDPFTPNLKVGWLACWGCPQENVMGSKEQAASRQQNCGALS